ncbi:hypothetical protein [endosymbiont GvMRE of Glomus versiforme]|uniref:hypothetical protein n=1 Tax=endosymbiont GvMRE of Glomus versiforme TaxID=2039283 RepID=UPI000EC8F8BB|nr:hypothetical protein [endosymbiont GvMRE of Glomus versiforme]RHZ37430.1 hypothetical protein GvMRE_I1g559 [endosymbiont GvMRE of Glomus versiforme]
MNSTYLEEKTTTEEPHACERHCDQKDKDNYYWREKLFMLSRKYKACYECGDTKLWQSESMKCIKCLKKQDDYEMIDWNIRPRKEIYKQKKLKGN